MKIVLIGNLKFSIRLHRNFSIVFHIEFNILIIKNITKESKGRRRMEGFSHVVLESPVNLGYVSSTTISYKQY